MEFKKLPKHEYSNTVFKTKFKKLPSKYRSKNSKFYLIVSSSKWKFGGSMYFFVKFLHYLIMLLSLAVGVLWIYYNPEPIAIFAGTFFIITVLKHSIEHLF